jgi:homoserine acetyltransferase
MSEIKTFNLGDFKLKSGGEIPDAFIAYKTFGDPSSPAIIYPTWYSGTISTNEWLIGDSMALSPKRYYIIVPALIGNGESSSPSNTPGLRPWPAVTFYDNVRAQHRLATEGLGMHHARCVLGWSMGAGQTYQWATQYPGFMDLAVPFLGSARTSLHNQVFLEGVKSALLAAKGVASGGIAGGEAAPASQYRGWDREERDNGLKALGRVYAGWGFSQAFYREKLYETHLGFKGLEDFMVNFWEKWALSKDPENMLAMLHTWQVADVSDQEPYNKGNQSFICFIHYFFL